MNLRSRLHNILKATGWSQEQLAHELGVSFATLNSWINERSKPRQKALKNIDRLFLTIVGVDSVDGKILEEIKHQALKHSIKAKDLIENREMLNKLTLHLTYHTNTIEGSSMTLSDVEEVIFDHKVLSNRTAAEQMEARNHQATLHWLVERIALEDKNFILNEARILEIHLRLMNGIISNAGEYRNHSVRIMNSPVILANSVKIPGLISRLVSDINSPTNQNNLDVINELAITHSKFEQIHPFTDGNGRTGRLILLAQALKRNLMPPIVVKERKYAYYKYLELAQTEEKYDPLQMFIAESIQVTNQLLIE